MAHRVIAAALGPADHRKNTVTHRTQPIALLTGGKTDISFRPFPRPEIFLAIEAGRAHPVLQSEVVGVLDAKAALFRRINQKKSAERPERLAAKALFAFLVQQNDAPAGVGDLGGRYQPRQTTADHN